MGLYRSLDGGGSWSYFPAPGPVVSLAASGPYLFAASGQAGDSGGIRRSADSGRTWTRLRPALPDSLIAALDSATGLLAFGPYLIAGNAAGLFRSSDRGATWVPADVGAFSLAYLQGLGAIGPDLYACTYDGILRSADSGAAWSSAAALPPEDFPQVLSVAGDGRVLLAQGTEVAYRSDDGGKSWMRLDTLPEATFQSLLGAGTDFYASRDDAIFRSRDGGITWSRIGSAGNPIEGLAAEGGVLFAGTYSGGLYRSSDGGAAWARLGMPGAKVQALGAGAGGVFAGLAEDINVYRSPDRGASWEPGQPPQTTLPSPGFPMDGVADLSGDGKRMLARIAPAHAGDAPSGRLRFSADGGITWKDDGSGARFGRPFQAGSRLFAYASLDPLGAHPGLYRSDDSGTTWARVSDGIAGRAWASIGPILLGADGRSLYRSADAGVSWRAAGPDLGETRALAAAGTEAYAATAAGLFRSSDSGGTWTLIRSDMRDIQVLCAHDSMVFAGTAGGGSHVLLASADRGVTWVPTDQGLLPAAVTALAVSGPDLFAGTDGAGVWRRPLAELATVSLARAQARSRGGRRSGLVYPGLEPDGALPGIPLFDAFGRRSEGSGRKRPAGIYFRP